MLALAVLSAGVAIRSSANAQFPGQLFDSLTGRVAGANPINYVDRHDPPLLIMHGQQNLLVPYNQGVLLYRALARDCNTATLFTLPQAPHGFVGDPTGLEDPAVNAGATVQRTRNCRNSAPRPKTPSWAFVARRLHRHLDRG